MPLSKPKLPLHGTCIKRVQGLKFLSLYFEDRFILRPTIKKTPFPLSTPSNHSWWNVRTVMANHSWWDVGTVMGKQPVLDFETL